MKYKIVFLLLCVDLGRTEDRCDRRPLGTKSQPLPADNKFKIDIKNIVDDKYIPSMKYEVNLFSTDEKSTFIAFTISAKEDTKPNEKNPRRPIPLDPGTILPKDDGQSMKNSNCNNTVIQTDITPKKSVQITWTAPGKDNRCVTIFALVAIRPDVWYKQEGPLSRRVCEDQRKSDDMPPMINDNCQVCQEARYLLTFEGLWSFNTHPRMFPTTAPDLARFSDLVGAAHSNKFNLWQFNGYATEGLRMLAEQGNTTQLENEIQNNTANAVRTIIKASGCPKPNMTTTAMFRATKDHHFLSLAVAILPSPDWFLGVSNMELCDAEATTPRWSEDIRLNLYPMDAGTDSGGYFESPNEETLPFQPIIAAVINKTRVDKPFARIHLHLIRTYQKPQCLQESETKKETGLKAPEGGYGNRNFNFNPGVATEYDNKELPVDRDSSDLCPMTPWEDWVPCDGECINGTMTGLRSRTRFHLVGKIAVGKYSENNPAGNMNVEVPDDCQDEQTFEIEECTEPCGTAVSQEPSQYIPFLKPGETWQGK